MDSEQSRQIDELTNQIEMICKSASLDRGTKTSVVNALLVALAKLVEQIIGPPDPADSGQPGRTPRQIEDLLGPEIGRLAEEARKTKAQLAAADMRRMAEDLVDPIVERLEAVQAENDELRRQVAAKERIADAKAKLEPVARSGNGHKPQRPRRNIY